MPSGKKHLAINKNIFIVILVIFYLTNFFVSGKWFLIGYLFAIYYLTPDLDMDRTDTDRNWGALQIWWNVYSKIFVHRGISHSIFLGTITRVFYLFILIIIFYVLFSFVILDQNIGIIKPVLNINRFIILNDVNIIKFIGGIFIADLCHLMADWYFSGGKEISNKYILIILILTALII